MFLFFFNSTCINKSVPIKLPFHLTEFSIAAVSRHIWCICCSLTVNIIIGIYKYFRLYVIFFRQGSDIKTCHTGNKKEGRDLLEILLRSYLYKGKIIFLSKF